MLSAIDVRLYPKSDCILPHPCAHMLHAALLDMVRKYDGDASQALHDDAQCKPFSISTLWGKGRAKGDMQAISRYTECRFRLCTVGRNVFESFSLPLFTGVAKQSAILVGNTEFVLLESAMAGRSGGVTTFGDLLNADPHFVELKFVSPTTFRRRGLNVPIPDPGLVYGSLWQKWQAFSDTPVEEGIFEEMTSALVLCRAAVHTRVWKYPHFMMTGFVGKAGFELAKPVSQEARQLFGALSGLAFYTGVGYKTTMGMGQCFRMDESDTEHRDRKANP